MQRGVIFRIGTSGWVYPHWRQRFYPAELPARKWFEYYSGVFDTVEVNNTFYRLPEAGVFERWRNQAPPAFLYAVKASRFLTHIKKLKEAAEPLATFLDQVRLLGPHLGPILYQLPPRWKPDLGRLENFCRLLPRNLTHVMEFRNADWLREETFRILRQHGICLCIHDLLPEHPREITGSALYVRFHGTTSRYSGSYSDEQLQDWANWLRDAAGGRNAVYAYFNNDVEGHAIRNALKLREQLGKCAAVA